MQSSNVDELSKILTIYFQQLVNHTHECVAEYFNDGENFKHYFSPYSLIYTFYLVDKLCEKQSFEKDIENRLTLLLNIFMNAFALPEDDARDVALRAADMAMDASKRTVEEDWKLGQIIFRMASRDANIFTFDGITKQQLDNYNIILLLNNY